MKLLVCLMAGCDSSNLFLVAKMVLNDFLRGKIPWYIPDPSWPDRTAKESDDKAEEIDEETEAAAMLNEGIDEEREEEDDGQGWNGLDVESDQAEGIDEGTASEDLKESPEDENERISDTRPPKKLRTS